MKRFKKILVYANLPPAADPGLDRAVKLAQRNDAALKIVDIVPDGGKHARSSMHDRQECIERLVAPLAEQGVDVTTAVLRGRSCVEIIGEVIRNHHDLVIKTARIADLAKFRLLGPTAIRLMRMCPCPVWVVQPSHHEPYRRIVAAVDLALDDPTTKALSRKVVELATSLAESDGSEVHVVCPWTAVAENTLVLRMGSNQFAEYIGAMQEETEARLKKFVSRFGDAIPEDRVHLLKGDPDDVIPQFNAQNDVDLIVMGAAARGGVVQLVLGNTPATVLQRVDCSLLVVKRDDYVRPVPSGQA